MSEFHVPVLLKEILNFLNPQTNNNFIDGTVGDGGHAEAILERTAPNGKLLGLDLDEAALIVAAKRLAPFGKRFIAARANFRDMADVAAKINFSQTKGVLLDLGIRAAELEESGRGFSFKRDEPLDMRFGGLNSEEETAAVVINTRSAAELERLFREYGEERLAKEIAADIVDKRKKQSLATSGALAEVILEVYRRKLKSKKEVPWIGGIHPATRVFQALRLEVNHELENLREALQIAPDILASGGRLAIISFHSLEDRIVKRAFRDDERLKIITKKPIVPTEDEIALNPKSRSGKLRVAERI